MLVFNHYAVTLRHDGGVVVILTAAQSADDARDMVVLAEGAPLSAVLAVECVGALPATSTEEG